MEKKRKTAGIFDKNSKFLINVLLVPALEPIQTLG